MDRMDFQMRATGYVLLFSALFTSEVGAKEITTIAGDWKCEYSARHETDRTRASSMWFSVTLKDDGSYDGNGKSIAAGISSPSRMFGEWQFADGTLTLTGHTNGPFGKLPFRFQADDQSDGELRREWTKKQMIQSTRCSR